MDSYADQKLQNELVGPKFKDPVGVFIGGTAGIGEGSAYAFAKHTTNPTIYIVGRNKEAGEAVLAKCKELAPGGTFYFYSYDLSLVKNAKEVGEKIAAQEKKINSLVVSCGTLDMPDIKTEEGLNPASSLVLYSRWKVVETLLPLLNAAADLGEPARVLSVLNPSMTGVFNAENLQKSGIMSIIENVRVGSTITSLQTLIVSAANPRLTMIHVNPGFVDTNLGSSLAWYLRLPMKAIMSTALGESAEACGERMFNFAFVSDKYQSGPYLVNAKGRDLKFSLVKDGCLTDADKAEVVTHMAGAYKQAGV